jgi:hypothetical protein
MLFAAGSVLFLLGRALGGGGAVPEPAAPGQLAERAPSAAATVIVPATPPLSAPMSTSTPATTSLPSSRQPPSSAKAVVTACRPAALQVLARPDAPSYTGDRLPQISLEFANVSKASCRLDAGSRALELVVMSQGDRIWSSDDCNPSKRSRLKTLAPGERDVVVVTWARDQSAPKCPDNRPAAKPGAYVVIGRVGAVHSVGTSFLLEQHSATGS